MRGRTASVSTHLLLAAMLIALFAFLFSIPSSDAEEPVRDSGSGPCGEDMHWAFNLNGTLSIYGSGDSWDYSEMDNPLLPYADKIEIIKIDFGVRSVDPQFLAPCKNVRYVDVGRDMVGFSFESDELEEVTLKKRIDEESGYLEYFSVGFGYAHVTIYGEDLRILGEKESAISFKQIRGTDVPVELRTVVGADTLYEFKAGDLTEFENDALISIYNDSALHFKVMHLQPDYQMAEGLYHNYNITFACDEPGYLLVQMQKKTFIPYPEAVGAILVLFFTACAYVYYRKVLRGLES